MIADRRRKAGRSREHDRNNQRPGIDTQIITQRNRNGRNDDGHGIIGHNLGHDHRQDVDRKHQSPRRHFPQEGSQFGNNQVDAAGLLQTQAHREHTEDQDKNIAIDRTPGFFRVDTACQQDRTHGQYGRNRQRDDVESGKNNHRNQCANSNRRTVPAKGADLGLPDSEQVGVLVHAANIFAGARHQQPVRRVDTCIGQVRPRQIAITGHAQYTNIELRQEGNVKQPIADARVIWRHRGLDQFLAQGSSIAFVDNADFEVFRFSQGNQLREIQLYYNPVTGPQLVKIKIMTNIAAQPLDRRDFQTCPAQFGDSGQLLVNHGCIAANGQFGEKGTFVAAVKLAFDITAWQQPATEQYHHNGTRNGSDQAVGRDFENPETGQTLIARNRIDDEVGRGTDQRGRTAQYADEAKRDQQFLGRETGCPRQAQDYRDQDNHDRRVVHESRRDKSTEKHLGNRQFGTTLRALDDETGDRVDRPGSQQGSRKDEHRRNGDRRGVGEDRKQAIGIDDPEKQEHAGPKHRNHCCRKALHDEPGEEEAEDHETDDHLVGLNIFIEDVKNEVDHGSGTAFNIAHRLSQSGPKIGDSFFGVGATGWRRSKLLTTAIGSRRLEYHLVSPIAGLEN